MHTVPCQNCKGHGILSQYKHIQDGICFTCHGTGKQDATKEEYNDHLLEIERKKSGSYILFNKGSIEYYKTTKEITKKYGNFFTGQYGSYSCHISYKDQNIVFTSHTSNSNNFINEATQQYNRYNQKLDNEYKELLQLKLNKLNKQLKEETDHEWKEMITNKINEIESLLTNLK